MNQHWSDDMIERGRETLYKKHPYCCNETKYVTVSDVNDILEAMKAPEVKVTMTLSPCCNGPIEVRLNRVGEWCMKCGRKIEKDDWEKLTEDPVEEAYQRLKKRIDADFPTGSIEWVKELREIVLILWDASKAHHKKHYGGDK